MTADNIAQVLLFALYAALVIGLALTLHHAIQGYLRYRGECRRLEWFERNRLDRLSQKSQKEHMATKAPATPGKSFSVIPFRSGGKTNHD